MENKRLISMLEVGGHPRNGGKSNVLTGEKRSSSIYTDMLTEQQCVDGIRNAFSPQMQDSLEESVFAQSPSKDSNESKESDPEVATVVEHTKSGKTKKKAA